MESYLLLSFHLLPPGGVDGIHHPLDGEVGDGPKDGQAEDQPHHLIAAQRPRERLGVHHAPAQLWGDKDSTGRDKIRAANAPALSLNVAW